MNSQIEAATTAESPVVEADQSAPHTVEALSAALAATKALSRESRIAVAAYYQAEKRGFVAGGELEDWLRAQHEMV